MSTLAARLPGGFRRNPIAAGIASLLALTAPQVTFAGNTWNVTSCTDSAPGSLRAIISAPATLSGDTVDLNTLSCPNGTLDLVSSSITIAQNSLAIVGPGKDVLKINSSPVLEPDRLFNHTGTGTLDIRNVTLAHGQVYRQAAGQTALGGCIYSKGDVYLLGVKLAICNAVSLQSTAAGGAVYTKGDLGINQSTISGSQAFSGAAGSNGAAGGGIAAHGTLTVVESTISGNTVAAPNGIARGGGAWSAGNAEVKNSVEVSGNYALSDHGSATGGGIFTQGNLKFNYSTLSGNTASLATTGGGCAGGGAAAMGDLSVKYSTIDSNTTVGSPTQTSSAGLLASGNIKIEASTISNNTTAGIAGALYATDNGDFDRQLFLRNTTVSGNHGKWIGGISSSHKTNSIYNSTIAFNTADQATINNVPLSPGVHIGPFFQNLTAKFQSSIVSNNTTIANVENDFGTTSTAFTVQVTLTDSLLRASSVPLLPTNSACPLLGPLRNNGGLTQTHALMSKSPVLEHGNNDLINPNTLSPYGFDQRGPSLLNGVMDFVRVTGSFADMGAYEVQKDDIAFNAGFDGCPAVP